MTIDNVKYHIEKEGSISTKAMIKNTKEECKLTTLKRVYLYKLPIDKYISIFNNFVDNLIEEKVKIFKHNYIFSQFEIARLVQLANTCPRISYENKTQLIEDGQFAECLYIIVSGNVSCYKHGKLQYMLNEGDILGEIYLFTQYESNYDYYAEENCVVIQIIYSVLNEMFENGENLIQMIMIKNIFKNAIKSSRVLSKYFSDDNYSNIFDMFQLKYYFLNPLSNKKIKKVYVLLAGSIKQTNNDESKMFLSKGQFLEEEIILDDSQLNKYSLFSDECLVLESSWTELTKNIFPYSDKTTSFYKKMLLLRGVKALKEISEYKLFSLAECLKCETYQ